MLKINYMIRVVIPTVGALGPGRHTLHNFDTPCCPMNRPRTHISFSWRNLHNWTISARPCPRVPKSPESLSESASAILGV